MGQCSDITLCDLFLILFFLSRTNPEASMGMVYDSFQKEQLLATPLCLHFWKGEWQERTPCGIKEKNKTL